MKKKIVSVMLAICLTATVVSGCGGTTSNTETENEAEVVEEVQEDVEAPEEEVPTELTYETVTYDVSVTEADEEEGTYKAYDAAGQEYVLTPAEDLSDAEKELLTVGAGVKVSTEVEVTLEEQDYRAEAEEAPVEESEETEAADKAETDETKAAAEVEEVPEEQAPVEITVTAVESLDESTGYELNQSVQQATLGYTIEDMTDTQMYAKSSVNVRKGPSADDEKVGSLSTAQEVTVNGLTSTNWYRISYNDGEAYVSAHYLQNEKPVVQTAKASSELGSSSGSSSGSSTAASSDGSSVTGAPISDAYLVYSSAEMDAAYAAGDMATYDAMLQANIDAADAKYGTTWGSASAEQTGGAASSGGSSSGSSSFEKSTSTSKELADYINQKRKEEGKGSMTWSDSLASIAEQRAEEIVDNFSHETLLNTGYEIIQKTPSGDVASWFTNFYNSAGHRANMMSSYNSSVGAAVCHCGNYYYIVVLFDI